MICNKPGAARSHPRCRGLAEGERNLRLYHSTGLVPAAVDSEVVLMPRRWVGVVAGAIVVVVVIIVIVVMTMHGGGSGASGAGTSSGGYGY